jgi:ankyrin repeat protein
MNIDFESIQFRHFLQHLAKENVTIELKDQKLIASFGKGKGKSHEPLVDRVCQFLENNQSNLKKTDIQTLKKLEKKLLEGASDIESQKKINEIFGKLVKTAENPPKASVIRSVRSEETLIVLSPPPKTPEERNANLSMVLSHYPKYRLGNDLEVYDATYSRVPKDLDREKIRAALDKEDIQDNAGDTALHHALNADNISAAKLLLENGAKTDLKNKAGTSAIDLMKSKGFDDLLNKLA